MRTFLFKLFQLKDIVSVRPVHRHHQAYQPDQSLLFMLLYTKELHF